MKTCALLLLLISCPAYAAAEDCAKNADACSGGSLKSSPFVQASLRENLPPAPPAAKAKRAVMREAAPPAVAASSAPVPAPAPVSAPAQDGKPGMSSPLWLLFVAAVLAGLYLYLGAGRRKGRKR
jgi:hypothetical protein